LLSRTNASKIWATMTSTTSAEIPQWFLRARTRARRYQSASRSGGYRQGSEVERFYREHFVGHWPDDVEVDSISRTVGQNRVIDELIVSFTDDREMRVFLPGVAPTGRKVVLWW
jgi:hypothetical protein